MQAKTQRGIMMSKQAARFFLAVLFVVLATAATALLANAAPAVTPCGHTAGTDHPTNHSPNVAPQAHGPATPAGTTTLLFRETGPAVPGKVVVNSLHFSGNTFTREEVITRELLFLPGDTLGGEALQRKLSESRQNLMNTGLFNFVEITVEEQAFPLLNVHISFVERWNIWPLPVVELDEPNLNQWLEDPDFKSFNYGINLLMSNLTGRNERVSLLAKTGNVQSINLQLTTPYFDHRQVFRWGMRYSLHRSKRRAYATEDNQQLFVRLSDTFLSTEYLLATRLDIRPRFYTIHSLDVAYHYHNYADTLLTLNPRFGPLGNRRFSFMSLAYSFRHDRRDIMAYPLEGFLAEGSIRRKGIWGLESMDVTTIRGTFKHYVPLVDRWYAAWSLTGKWSEGSTLSYFDQEGLGFTRSLVRGYEPYVIDGHKYLIVKSNIKYNLLPERVTEIPFIPTEKLSRIHYAIYLNFFVDAGTINDRHYTEGNTLANKWLGGSGLGIDLHTYYDKVLRCEFSVNRHGEAGVFFHLVAPI